MKRTIIIALSIFFMMNIQAQIITPEVVKRADTILKQMTLEEKLAYIGGHIDTYPGIKPIPRLNLPTIRMADGPQGIRSYRVNKSTLYPAGVLVSATWNPRLIEKFGVSFGRECRARGIHVLLGPGVNIYRSPLCGRNFEYYGEDPYLAGETAVSFIKGIQSQEVVATIKHFAANNQEWDRRNVSSDVDERTLHEIYLKPFEKAVKEANVGAVMNSYNLLNGTHTSEHPYLNIEVLRNMWGFKGILMSDWGSTKSPVATANGGLDIDMPGGRAMNQKVLMPAINSGKVTEETINAKVRHILETIIAFGFLDREQEDKTIPLNDPFAIQTALELAREGIVMLKNDNNTLPVSKDENFLILGPNATKCVTGGGSGGLVTTHSCTHLLDGMKTIAGTKNVKFNKLLQTYSIEKSDEFYTDKKLTTKGFIAEYYNNANLNGTPFLKKIDSDIDFKWKEDEPIVGSPKNHFSARWKSVYRPAEDALVVFRISGTHGFRMFINDKEVMTNWVTYQRNYETSLRVEAGKKYDIRIEHFNKRKEADFKLTYEKFNLDNPELINAIEKTDNILLAVGFDGFTEKENQDRSFELPQWQLELIDILATYNKKLITFIYAGGGVDFTGWSDKVQGIFMTWYGGQEGGQAMAEILTGAYSPSGKLPITIEKSWSENPVYNSYYADIKNSKHVTYREGIFVGYRGYDKKKIEPAFPFGYGMSYSSFDYKNFKVEPINNMFEVSFDISNIGNYDAAEIAQVYVSLKDNKISMPVKELKGYEKVYLKKGETKRVSVMLDKDAFTYYDVGKHQFVPHKGGIEIMVGKSSRDIVWNQLINTNTNTTKSKWRIFKKRK